MCVQNGRADSFSLLPRIIHEFRVREVSLSVRGQWACTLRRSANIISTATIEEKCKALPSTSQVGVSWYSCVRSLYEAYSLD